jgi:hypothetical protein
MPAVVRTRSQTFCRPTSGRPGTRPGKDEGVVRDPRQGAQQVKRREADRDDTQSLEIPVVKPRFAITSEGRWLASEFGDEIARASLGQLEIRIDGRYLTKLEDTLARALRDFANLSAYDLAFWLAANWWRLRWEPERSGSDWRMSHSLGGVGRGYVWPDITVMSDGERVVLASRATPWCRMGARSLHRELGFLAECGRIRSRG